MTEYLSFMSAFLINLGAYVKLQDFKLFCCASELGISTAKQKYQSGFPLFVIKMV